MYKFKSVLTSLIPCVCLFTIFGEASSAQEIVSSITKGFPAINVAEGANGETQYSLSLQILALMTGLTVLPSLVLGMTSFTRVIIVLSILRQAMGTQSTPPNQVLIGLSLFLTYFVMAPVLTNIYDEAFDPYVNERISAQEAMDKAAIPLREFMLAQTREDDILMFAEIADHDLTGDPADIPFRVLAPSFMTSELKTAFTIGFLIYIPFVIIDLVVASVLMSMGMMMLSPMMISMPFKLMLFVLADGWALITQSLTTSFAVT